MIQTQTILFNGLPVHVASAGRGENAIVFVHGNSCSSDMWQAQFNDPELQQQYRLVAFDCPGHGQSARSDNYRFRDMAGVLPAMAEELGLENYIVVGLSLGTAIIGEAAPLLKGCKGYFMLAPNLTNNEYHPGVYIIPFPEIMVMMSPDPAEEELTRFAEHLFYLPEPGPVENYKKSFRQTDPAFRTALGAAIGSGDWSDQLANIAATGKLVALVFGKEERILNTHYLDAFPGKWRNQVFHIEKAGHFSNIEQPETINRLLMEFAADAFK